MSGCPSTREHMTNPSPEGRGWPEGAGEGYKRKNTEKQSMVPLTRRFAAPSPFGRGILICQSLLSENQSAQLRDAHQ
jgi:hypothetical protein